MLANPIAVSSSYTTAIFGLAGSLIGGFIAGAVSLLVARQTREAAEGAWIRDNRRQIYDRFLRSGQRLLIACEARWNSRHDRRPDNAPIAQEAESGVESAHADFFEAYSVVQTVAETTLVDAARFYGYRFLELEAIMDSKGVLERDDFDRVAQLVREARHDTIDAMRSELRLKETNWPPKDYNPFKGTDLEQKYADRRPLTPLVTEFRTELCRRLGGTTAEWAARVHLLRAKDDSKETDLVIDEVPVATVIEVDENLSDEAKQALLDLDIQSDTVRGQRLRWDTQAAAWLPKGDSRHTGSAT